MKSDAQLVVYEPDSRINLFPLTLTSASFDLILGTCTILDRIERAFGRKVENLFVPEYLKETVRERHPEVKVNELVDEKCVVVSSLIAPRSELLREASTMKSDQDTVFTDSHGDPVFACLERFGSEGFSKKIAKKELGKNLSDHALIRYPWELVSHNSQAIIQDFVETRPRQVALRRVGARGTKISVADSVDLESNVTLDSRSGPIILDEKAEVQSFSRIEGPCYVGKKTKVKSALLRGGTTVGEECRVSGEIEESVISSYTNKNHEGFIGHSYIGSWVNLGALTTNSDLKNSYGTIKMKVGNKVVDTGSMKVGVFIGDMCKTAIGTLIFSGKSIGVSSQLFGTVTEDVPSFTFYGKSLGSESKELILESAVETQKRMMQRRNVPASRAYLGMIRSVFEMTQSERKLGKVKKGRFEI
ncbi:MAG: hypothetical protein M1587_05930 [Thaumarchaeota archaeon]|nr:hypothetical protein [Nitrososphaerota archaeon]MCL5067655.1 hypothetical protein [Nitrososphaerota archaeon]